MTADALLTRHAAAWQADTVDPFLAGVRDGSVPQDAFNRCTLFLLMSGSARSS